MSAYLLIVILNLFGTHNIQDASSTYSANNKPFFEAETLIQKGIKSVFDELDADLDTFSWHNYNINSGRIDCSYLFDTVKIKLIDSSLNRFYIHPSQGHITSDFGERQSTGGWHYGVDIKLMKGDTVRAAFDGIVRVTKYDKNGYGNVVVIRHHNGIETIYGHLSKYVVKTNHKIKAGDVVGLGGSTGRSSGNHLHFEMRYYGEPFNPNHIIDFENFQLKSNTLALFKDDFSYLTEMRKAVWYKVCSGDNLGKIANKFNTSVNTLCRLNKISPESTLSIGKKLLVRAATSVTTKQPSAQVSNK
ncbi:MAG: peptidoglycan DD-metalloendopeptidase family protein [Fibrobacter sp.]|nr:peptidoglycan DD-metalloendopeptidase family protein [Fibrobacter sp.]